ncbi:pentapeptide repeat-containing protein [Microbacterium indicum]|uniref:pentapeptide repeat-containing protein n=1 Tax=Microbacterium indicum TaxID=358100 RepID=UPI000403AB18|nr:pentapeptide repeat-containing protein [Microbacterium indicum]
MKAPSLPQLGLEDLRPGDAYDLAPRTTAEGLSFDALTLDAFDIEGGTLIACDLAGVRAPEGSTRYAQVLESRVKRLDVPVLRGTRSRWRDVEVRGSRLGSVESFDSAWEAVHFVDCRLGFVNFRGSTLQDVTFTDCTIDELDLGQSKITRFAAPGTRISRLDVAQATLRDVDLRGADLDGLAGVPSLRGATISSLQLQQLARLLAESHGIAVEG